MNKEPLISILSSIYNERSYIEQTINSVLNQSYNKWEWIIIDDGSTDGTGELLMALKDKRIRYISQTNSGWAAKNYNQALRVCTGDLVATLDGDDYWPLNKLEVQLKSFDDHNVVLSYGECCLINARGKKIGHVRLPEDPVIAHNDPAGSALHKFLTDIECFICNTSVVYRKKSLLEVGGFVEENGLFHDFPTWIKLSLIGTFSPVPTCVGYYRKHLRSTTFQTNHEHYFKNQVRFLKAFYHDNAQRLRDIGLPADLCILEKNWDRMHMKSRLIYRLTLLSSLMGTDLLTPLISFVNSKPQVKSLLKKLLFL